MAENKEITAEAEVKTPAVEVEKEVSAAPATGKPAEAAASDAPDEEDISNVISLFNEIQTMSGGKGDITELPENLIGTVKFMLGKMVALRDAFQDPLFKSVLDDMVDQQKDGKTPSLLVAVARNVPMEELQDLADNENYADVQGAVDERLAKDKADLDAEEALSANFDESQAAGQEYAKEMNYDDAEMQELFSTAMAWFSILGDGKLTKDEWAKVDKMRNYDRDTEELRKQIPEVPKKEVVPDQASMETAMKETPKATKVAPRNSIEAMNNAAPAMTDFTQTGKRRFGKK
jgi:hypothetical protein